MALRAAGSGVDTAASKPIAKADMQVRVNTCCDMPSSTVTAYLSYVSQERMAFLREDLTHLFDDQGIDQSAYDDKVDFQDPITRYSSVKGVQ